MQELEHREIMESAQSHTATTNSHPDKLAPQTLSKPLGYLVTNRVW